MKEFIIIIFLLLFIYFITKTVIYSMISNRKRELRMQKFYIKNRIKTIKYKGPITEEEKNKFKEKIHSIIMESLKRQTFISLFQKYIGIPGAMFAIIAACITLFNYQINKHFNPLIELIDIIKNTNIYADQDMLLKLKDKIEKVGGITDGSLAISLISQILLTILLIADLFTNQTQILREELDEIQEELLELLADA